MDVTVEQRPELPLSERKLLDAALSHPLRFSLILAERSLMKTPESNFFCQNDFTDVKHYKNMQKRTKTGRSKIVSKMISVGFVSSS